MARAGVEPATTHFSGERSYQLSYLAVHHNTRIRYRTVRWSCSRDMGNGPLPINEVEAYWSADAFPGVEGAEGAESTGAPMPACLPRREVWGCRNDALSLVA